MPSNHVEFTREMREAGYTILVPNMLEFHFSLIVKVLRLNGYNAELLTNSGPNVMAEGLKYVHNDTCVPALLVIGQFLDALHSGKQGGRVRAADAGQFRQHGAHRGGQIVVPRARFGHGQQPGRVFAPHSQQGRVRVSAAGVNAQYAGCVHNTIPFSQKFGVEHTPSGHAGPELLCHGGRRARPRSSPALAIPGAFQ